MRIEREGWGVGYNGVDGGWLRIPSCYDSDWGGQN
jgi:hypothetical protein